MKKIFLIMFCMILLVGTISAEETFTFDNVKQYNEETKIVTIKNTFGIGRDIATIQLKTPLNVMVGAGYQPIAIKELELLDDTYEDAFNDMIFINKKNNEEIERDFDYKYLTTELVNVNDYKTSCNILGNGTKICSYDIIGIHQESKEVWKDLDTSVLTKGKITIGIFTDVQVGDYVEWIPTLFGKEIDEWAIWTANLNVSLVNYYKFDEQDTSGSGTIIDQLDNNNGTNDGADNATGKINTAYDFVVANEDSIGMGSVATYDNYTWSAWINLDTYVPNGDNYFIIGKDISGTRSWVVGLFTANEQGFNTTLQLQWGTTQTFGRGINLSINQWYNIVITMDDDTDESDFWVNGVNVGSFSNAGIPSSSSSNMFIGKREYVGSESWFNGQIDEVGIWNRTLTDAEIKVLYNQGLGCTINLCTPVPPTITINSPIDNFETLEPTITFNGTIVSTDSNAIANVSLILNDTYIETNTSGVNNSNYIFTETLGIGAHSWIYESCNNESTCINSTTRTLTINYFSEEDIFYNSTSYETKGETFIMNLTTNGTYPTSAIFYHDGISQGASTKIGTDTNANFSNTLQIPLGNGTKEFYWEITLGTIEEDSTKTNQTINETVWAYCNASYTTPFLNVSFKDEADLSFINATIPTSNFIYYLGDGTITKTYTYVNVTENFYYDFCATPNLTMSVNSYIQYKKGTDYPQRIYDPDLTTYTNDTTDLILYLLGTTDGIYVTFQVINTANLVLSGVDMNASREISGSDVEVGTGTTGADGGVTLWLNPDFIHDFVFNKSGFPILSESFAPTQSSYTITLGGDTEPEISYFRGIDYSILPVDSSLTNDTTYTFGFNLTSSFWSLTEYGFDLRLVNGTIITGGSTSASGTPLTLAYNTINQTKVYLDYYWLINETYTNGTRLWLVYNTENTQWSIGTFFTDFNTYMDSGFFGIDNFGRYLIIFIVIFFSIGIMSYKFGFTSPINISVMTFLIVFFFDVVVGIIPPLSVFSGTEVNYLLTFLTGLIAVMVVLREATRV